MPQGLSKQTIRLNSGGVFWGHISGFIVRGWCCHGHQCIPCRPGGSADDYFVHSDPSSPLKIHAVLGWRRHVFSRAIPDIAKPPAPHHSALVCSRPDFILDTSSRPISHRNHFGIFRSPASHTHCPCLSVYLLAISTEYLLRTPSVHSISCCQLGGVISDASSISTPSSNLVESRDGSIR